MEKNYSPAICPDCHGSNIEVTMSYDNLEKRDTLYRGEEAIRETREKVLCCNCRSCSINFSIIRERNNYVLMKKPFQLTGCGDVRLLAIFKSDFDSNFEVVELDNCFGDGNIVMALVEDEKFPILLPRDEDVEKDYDKVKSIVYNTRMRRNR